MHDVIVAQLEAAGLVVGSDKDEGLVGMLGVELEHYVYGLCKVICLLDVALCVVVVSGTVYLPALHHEEEALPAIVSI